MGVGPSSKMGGSEAESEYMWEWVQRPKRVGVQPELKLGGSESNVGGSGSNVRNGWE